MVAQGREKIMPDLNKIINRLSIEIQIADYACLERTKVSVKLLKDVLALLERKSEVQENQKAEIEILSKRLMYHDCNTCKRRKQMQCQWMPNWGEQTRTNCIYWIDD